MSTNAIVYSYNANIDNVTFSEAKKNKQGGTSIAVKYDNQNFKLRLPRLTSPAGLLKREDEKSGNVSYSLITSLKGCDPYAKERSTDTADTGPLYNFLLDFQEKIIKTATENSSKWFGKKRSEESIRDSFKNILSVSVDKVGDEYVPNGKYPPSFRLKVPVYDGRVAMEAVDNKARPYHLSVESLLSVFPKYVDANLIVSGSVYIIGQSFGVTWKVEYAQVFPPSRLTAASVFVSDEHDTAANTAADVADEVEATVAVPVMSAAPQPFAQEAAAEVLATSVRKKRSAVPN